MTRCGWHVLLAWLALRLALPALATGFPAYQVLDLGADVDVFGVDDAGVAYGEAQGQAALLRPGLPPLLLGPPGRAEGVSASVRSRVVGAGLVGEYVGGPTGVNHGFVRYHGQVRDLPPPGGRDAFSVATGLTLRSVVGFGEDAQGVTQALVWPRPGPGVRVLPPLGGLHDAGGLAHAVIPGLVVGESLTNQRTMHATLWVLGSPQDLGGGRALGVARVGGEVMVVGDHDGHAWYWTTNQGRVELPLHGGEAASGLVSVNAQGVAVGWRTRTGLEPQQFPTRGIRLADGRLEDLNTLVLAPQWLLQGAVGMNATGVIVGNGIVQRRPRGYLLRPLP